MLMRTGTLLFAGAAMALCLHAGTAGAEDLATSLKSAYETNPRIKAERKALEVLDEGVAQAISGWRPNIGASYSRGAQKLSVNDSDWSDASVTGTQALTVTQPLFQGGGTVARTESANETVLAGRERLRDTEQTVLLDAVSAYMAVVRDQSVLDLSRNNVEVLKKQLEASRSRFEVGEVTRTDVAQSEARLARAESDATQANGNLMASRATFERVIGQKPVAPVAPTSFPTLPATLEEALNVGLKQNPALRSVEFSQNAAESNVDVALADILPDVSLQGRMQRQDGAGFSGGDHFDSDSLLVNVNLPLYQSGAEHSRIREAKSTASQRKFDVANAHDQTRQQIIQSWEGLQTALATITSSQAAIDAAEIALEGVKQEQLYGSRTVLDVLDAEQELFVAKVNLVRAEHDRIVAVYTLLTTTGQLSVDTLDLKTEKYDPKQHYDEVKYQFIGF